MDSKEENKLQSTRVVERITELWVGMEGDEDWKIL